MNMKLPLVILLLIALVGCSAPEATISPTDAPAATTDAPAATTDAPAATTDAPAATDESAATTEAPVATDEAAATTEAAAPQETGVADTGESVDVTTSQPTAIGDTSGYFLLQTVFQQEANKCLEGNRVEQEAGLADAAFLDDCQDVTGQLWKLVATQQPGYYQLQTMFLESKNKCLEGNRLDPQSFLGGASFMDDCQEVTGQSWRFIDAGDGFYRLQTMFLEAENKCLEGNSQAPDAVLSGAAFMDDCQDVSGQLWQLVPIADISSFAETPPPVSEQPMVPPVPLAVEVEGNLLSVVDPSSNLNGMTITALNESGALAQLELGKLTTEDVPQIPAAVTPFSDVFVVSNAVAQTVELRFPLDALPDGVALGDVNLYTYTDVADIREPIWSPVWTRVAFEGTEDAPIIVVTVDGLSGLLFWGHSPSENQSATGTKNNGSKVLLKPALAAQTQATCQGQTAFPGSNTIVAYICQTSELTVTIRGWGNAQTRWGSISVGQFADYAIDAQRLFKQYSLGYDTTMNIQLEATQGDGYIGGDYKTLHITNDNSRSVTAVQATVVHEYFHHAQNHPNTRLGTQDLLNHGGDATAWLIEGMAAWFEDELYDSVNEYVAFFGSFGQRIAQVGISVGYGNGLASPYQRFAIFKLLNQKCPSFNVRASLNGNLKDDPSGIKNFTDLFKTWGCDFGQQLGNPSSVDSMLAYYNYATQFKNKMSLLDANEADIDFFDKPSFTFLNWRGENIAQWLSGGRGIPTLSGVTSISPVGAYSFKVPAIAGELPAGKVAELTIEANQPITVSLTSNDRQLVGMNTIGPENDPHAWFLVASGNPGKYRYSANCSVPELFVTLINPDLKNTASGVKVTFQIVDGSPTTPQVPCGSPTPTAAPTATPIPTAVPSATPVPPTQPAASPTTAGAPTQVATAVPATATPVPPTQAPPTGTGSTIEPMRLEIGKQYALREANNTFRYVKLTHIRFNSAFVGYLFDPCPNPAEQGNMTLIDTLVVTTLAGAQAEGLRPTNEPCSDTVAPPYVGGANSIQRSASLKLEIGKQYVVRRTDNTYGYYQLVYRGTTTGGGVYYRGAFCPSPGRMNEININKITDILTVAEALAANIAPNNQPCNTGAVPHGS